MRLGLLLFTTLFSLSALAQQYKAFGDYQLHYIALDTTTLSADIARKAGLARSKKIGFFNVSLLDMRNSIDGIPVEPDGIKLSVTNLMQQDLPLDLVIHKEGRAIYYLAMFEKFNDDVLWFKVEVLLPGEEQWQTFKFSKKVNIQ